MKGVQAEAQTCAYRNTSVRRPDSYRMARFLDIKIAMIYAPGTQLIRYYYLYKIYYIKCS